MINGLLLLFKPAATWERIFRAQRSFFYILFVYLLPVMILSSFVEGYGLHRWGKWQGEVPHAKIWSVSELVVFEAGQLLATLVIIFANSAVVKSVCETFQPRHSFLQAFTVIAYGLFPLFLSRMLNAFSEITPWVSWLLGILLSIAVMYHGVPRVMQPDPAHAFGLYMSTALLLVLSTGLLELVVAFFLQGKLGKLERFISSVAARLPF
jgi:hypothetical protein